MGKSPRWWYKVPCLPLRLLLLALCAWAVYTISTGLISPSAPPPTTFARQEVNQKRFVSFPKSTFKQPFAKHVLQDSKYKAGSKKQQSRPITNAQKQNEHHKSSTISDGGESPLKDGILKEEPTKITNSTSPHESKRLSGHKRSLVHGLREKKHRDVNISQKKNTRNGLSEMNFDLNPSAHGSKSLQKTQKFDPGRTARLLSRYETHLRENRDHETGNAVLTPSNITQQYVGKYGFRYILPSEPPVLTKPKITHSSQISDGFKDIKTILLWTLLDNGWDFLPKGEDAFSSCSEVRCEITSDRNRLKDSHAVVFHVRTMSLLDLPPFRLAHQKWIFFCLEPPPQSYFPGFHFMRGMFNWTMTYRGDSDIVIPYGKVMPGRLPPNSNDSRNDWESLWKMKTRPVVWMVSHCNTYSKRELYVHQLQKFIDVDVFGGCGAAVCPSNKTYKCLEAFSRRYKFFLAFENSICDDYVTEKFFRALKYDIVPVVMGGADYGTVAPPGSYINAADFESPEALANHLHRVSGNSTLYRTYLKWRDAGYDIRDTPSHCSLCQKVRSSGFADSSTYTNIVKWWVENSHCTKWTLK